MTLYAAACAKMSLSTEKLKNLLCQSDRRGVSVIELEKETRNTYSLMEKRTPRTNAFSEHKVRIEIFQRRPLACSQFLKD
jgi:hypothetical protein